MPPRSTAKVRELVHVVCLPGRVEVFDDLDAAREYAAQDPAALRHSSPLRHGTEGAVLVANQRVVVRDGRVQSVWQSDVLDFYDGRPLARRMLRILHYLDVYLAHQPDPGTDIAEVISSAPVD